MKFGRSRVQSRSSRILNSLATGFKFAGALFGIRMLVNVNSHVHMFQIRILVTVKFALQIFQIRSFQIRTLQIPSRSSQVSNTHLKTFKVAKVEFPIRTFTFWSRSFSHKKVALTLTNFAHSTSSFAWDATQVRFSNNQTSHLQMSMPQTNSPNSHKHAWTFAHRSLRTRNPLYPKSLPLIKIRAFQVRSRPLKFRISPSCTVIHTTYANWRIIALLKWGLHIAVLTTKIQVLVPAVINSHIRVAKLGVGVQKLAMSRLEFASEYLRIHHASFKIRAT